MFSYTIIYMNLRFDLKMALQWLFLNDSVQACVAVPINAMNCRTYCGPCVVRTSTINLLDCEQSLGIMCLAGFMSHIAETREEVRHNSVLIDNKKFRSYRLMSLSD